jgi:hypothetical protein
MLPNPFRLIILLLLITLVQVLVNNSKFIYIDCIGIILMALIIHDINSLRLMILLGIFADLIGYWYLGSHLFAILIVSFFIKPMTNFFAMCGILEKTLFFSIFYIMFIMILITISIITHNLGVYKFSINILNIVVETLIACPILLWLIRLVIIKRTELIFN